MSLAKAQRHLLERLGAGSTILLALHLDHAVADADGVDAYGRSVKLVGAHALRQLPDGEAAVAMVLSSLKAGEVPAGVTAVSYQPAASAALSTIAFAPDVNEVLVDGGRNSGKTQILAGVLPLLAEGHVQAGLPLPFHVLALHDSLTNATAKTVPSLLEPHWGGLWSIREAGTVAAFTLGGVEMVRIFFVPADDQAGGERARAACHGVWAEEAIASMHEGGISERIYDLARNSMQRLPTPRRVAVVTTNPGSPESWLYCRFIEPGRPGCVRCPVPASDRLTPEKQRAQIESFHDVDLKRRLALGEWCGLQLGQQVTPNYNPATHVAPQPLVIERGEEVWMGWDSGGGAHCHATIIGQRVGREVRIFAGLISEETGLDQHLQAQVLPWISRRMPWLLGHGMAERRLLHRHDPMMDTKEGGNIEENGVKRVRRALGGSVYPGKVEWGERIGPLLDLLNQGNGQGGQAVQIDPGPDTLLLRRALSGEAYYFMGRGGQVARDNQHKPNHPWEDLLDAACYFAGGVAPRLTRERRDLRAKQPSKIEFDAYDYTSQGRRSGFGVRRAPSKTVFDR